MAFDTSTATSVAPKQAKKPAFDLSTWRPIDPSAQTQKPAFDLSTWRPIDPPAQKPKKTEDRSALQYVGETISNIPSSAYQMGAGLYEAVTNPIQTAQNLGLAAYGGARNVAEAALPTGAFEALKSIEDPETAQQAVRVANALGDVYSKRYGSVNQMLDTIRTDPVGAASDLSLILTGGAMATAKAPILSSALSKTAGYLDPVGQAAGALASGTMRGASSGLNNLLSDETKFINEITDGMGAEVAQAARSAPRYPGITPTFAEATIAVPAPRVQAFGREAAGVKDVAAETLRREKQEKMLSDLRVISKTEKERLDLKAARDAKAKEDYGKAFSQTVKMDDVVLDLLKRPYMMDAVKAAEKIAAERGKALAMKPSQAKTSSIISPSTGKPIVSQAKAPEFSVEALHVVKEGLDDVLSAPDQYGFGATQARAIGDSRKAFTDWLESKVPDYRTARQNYAKASKEIARADYGDFLIQKMTSSMSDEAPLRARNFANAIRDGLGPNAGASLRRVVGGGSRYDDIKQLLTPKELKIVEDVVGQLGRDEVVTSMAQRGTAAAPKFEELSKVNTIPLLNRTWTLAQAAHQKIASRLSEAKKSKIALAMLNADTMADLVEQAGKKKAFVDSVKKGVNIVGDAAGRVIKGPVGRSATRVETEANRNALLRDALGNNNFHRNR